MVSATGFPFSVGRLSFRTHFRQASIRILAYIASVRRIIYLTGIAMMSSLENKLTSLDI